MEKDIQALYEQYNKEYPISINKPNHKVTKANVTNFRKMKLQELLELSENNYISFQLKEILADEIHRRLSS